MNELPKGVIRMAFGGKRMGLSSPTRLNPEQIEAVGLALDAAAMVAKYSGQESALKLFADGLEYEFGQQQAEQIARLAPRYLEAIGDTQQSPPIPTTPSIATMGLRKRPARRVPNAAEVASAVTVLSK